MELLSNKQSHDSLYHMPAAGRVRIFSWQVLAVKPLLFQAAKARRGSKLTVFYG
jgi:hypothetical protein